MFSVQLENIWRQMLRLLPLVRSEGGRICCDFNDLQRSAKT
jgi:hypothetical protein